MNATPATRPDPIAIIGMGCLFPKAAGLHAYWRLLKEGVDAVSDIPATHWRAEEYFDADPKSPDRTYAKRGGFLAPIDFPPMEFGVTPHSIEATDASQLLGLVVAQEALRSAGYGSSGAKFNRDRTSVVLGVTGTLQLVIPLGARLGHPLWRKALKDAGVADDVAEDVVERIAAGYVPWQENSFPGLLGNVVAGRIANRLDLGGTNCVVDAACASSLSALHLATMELAAGKSDMVVTGGVDAFNDIFMYMCFSKTPALSPTGDSRPFDAAGDGTILGEGLGMVVLKRLADAQRDGDQIYAVIKGLGSSSDGKGNAIYAPSSAGQVKALRNAYAAADVSPKTIELVEGHGTGTKVGDAAELAALREVYRAASDKSAWCTLGSVKSQIGHTKAAAGAAGVIKAALSLHHKVLPPSIKVTTPLEGLSSDDSPFVLSTKKRPWVSTPEHPRRAAVSAFGFGGSNFHLILEEYESTKKQPDWDDSTLLVGLSAKTNEELLQKLSGWRSAGSWDELADQAADSLQAFDGDAPRRLLFVLELEGKSPAEVVEAARQAVLNASVPSAKTTENVFFGEGRPAGSLAALFPGQGSQYVGMLRDLACQFPSFLSALEAADASNPDSEHRWSNFIFPPTAFNDDQRARQEQLLRRTSHTQPALAAVNAGALTVLRDFGVKFEAAAGHSFGELTALFAAGAISQADLFRLASERGRRMEEAGQGRGAMLAVLAPLQEVADAVRDAYLDVVLANKNSPNQAVLSGEASAVDAAEKLATAKNWRAVRLPVAGAFHSRLVASAVEPFRSAVEAAEWAPSIFPAYSNTTGKQYPADVPQARRLLAEQLAHPVEFVEQIQSMIADGVRTFIEVGPGSRLSGLVKAIAQEGAVVLSLDASNGRRNGVADLARLLAKVAAMGYPCSLSEWNGGIKRRESRRPKPQGHTVSLSGANQYTPKRSPPRTPVADKPTATTRLTTSSMAAPIQTNFAGPAKPITDSRKESSAPMTASRPTSASAPPSQALPPTAPAFENVLQTTLDSMSTLAKLQEQTADLHRKFLEGQESAIRTLHLLAETQQRLALGGVNAIPLTPPSQAVLSTTTSTPTTPAPRRPAAPRRTLTPAHAASPPRATKPAPTQAPTTSRDVLYRIIAEKTGYPSGMLQPEMELDADLGIDSIKRVEIFSALQEALPAAPAVKSEHVAALRTLAQVTAFLDASEYSSAAPPTSISTSSASAEAAAGAPVVDGLMKIIAEKTGYPAEMLKLDMELDADLGIDSIKRVEIFSAVQEAFPQAPAVKSEHVGALRTLRQVVEFLGAGQSKSPSAAAASNDALIAGMLAVVSEKTGYPTEMLKLDMQLDADLGIDSIKRVEIFSAFQDAFPNAPAVKSEHVGSLRTLRAVADFLSQGAASTPPVKVETTVAPAIVKQTTVRLMVSSPRAVPLQTAPGRSTVSLAKGSTFWLLDDGEGLAAAAADELQRRGFGAGLISADDVDREPPAELAGLLLFAPAGSSDSHFLRSAFQLAKLASPALRRAAAQGGALLATISCVDGKFGLEGDRPIHDPLSGGLAGLAKTLAREWEGVHVKALDRSPQITDWNVLAQRIIDEAFLVGPIEVGVAPLDVCSVELGEATSNASAAGVRLTPGEVVLATGGARGVTAEVALQLAKTWKPTLVLIGRSPEPNPEPPWLVPLDEELDVKEALLARAPQGTSPREIGEQYRRILADREMRENLRRIEEAGAVVLYRSADVRDRQAILEIVAEVRRTVGPVRGVVHGAGVLADRKIEDQTIEQFDLVVETKVDGLLHLLDAVEDDDLAFLTLFSSSTGRFGRVGQLAYAVANEALNKIAQREARRRPNCRVVAFNWGPWAGGMVQPSLARLFESEGVGLIPLAEGAKLFVDQLTSEGRPCVEVVVIASTGKESLEKPASITPIETPLAATEKATLSAAFRRDLDVESHPFLKSHVLDGRAVLPTAMILEWFAHAALHGNPGFVLHGVNQLRIYKGLILQDDSPIEAQVFAGRPVRSGQSSTIEVELRSRSSDGREILHAAASVVVGRSALTPALPGALPTVHPFAPSMAQIYEEMLFHGPVFQGLSAMEGVSDAGLIATTEAAPVPSAWINKPLRNSWITDPLAVDAALQAIIVWGIATTGAPSLPCAADAYRQYQRSFPAAGVRIVVRAAGRSGQTLTADVDFLDEKNFLVASLTRCQFVLDEGLRRAFRNNQLAQPVLG